MRSSDERSPRELAAHDPGSTSSSSEDPIDGMWYGDVNYWEARYARSIGINDWYFGYETLQLLLEDYLPKGARVLHVGAGTSLLTEEMYRGGWRNIVSTDISKTAVEGMIEKYELMRIHVEELAAAEAQLIREGGKAHTRRTLTAGVPGSATDREDPEASASRYADDPAWGLAALEWLVSDVRACPELADASFDCVLDKGTVDALVCSDDDGEITAMMESVARVLRPGGLFMLITYGEPSTRLPFLMPAGDTLRYGWDVAIHAVEQVQGAGIKRKVGPRTAATSPMRDDPGGFEARYRWPWSDDSASGSDRPIASRTQAGCHYVYLCYKRGAPPIEGAGGRVCVGGRAAGGRGGQRVRGAARVAMGIPASTPATVGVLLGLGISLALFMRRSR